MAPESGPQVLTPGMGNSVSELVNFVSSGGFRKVMLVTGKKSFSWFDQTGLLRRLSQTCEFIHWAEVSPNPQYSDLQNGLEKADEFRPDVIVGVGGGSALDMAKLVAVSFNRKSNFSDLVRTAVLNRDLKLVLIPTTAGSGAEATRFAVLYHEGVKHSVEGPALGADLVILDPAPLSTCSGKQLAASGLDAFSQCVESIWSKGQTSKSLDDALLGLRLVKNSLVKVVRGDDSKAPVLQWGSHLSGRAINVSKTTAPHALSYFLTSEFGVPHGIAAASTLGYFMDYHNRLIKMNPKGTASNLRGNMNLINNELGISTSDGGRLLVARLFADVGLESPESYWPWDEDDIETWFDKVNPQRLANHPFSPVNFDSVIFQA